MSGSRSHSERMFDRYCSYLAFRNWVKLRPKWYKIFSFYRWVKMSPDVLDID